MFIYDLFGKRFSLATLKDRGVAIETFSDYPPYDWGDVGYFVDKETGEVFFSHSRMSGFLLWLPADHVLAFKFENGDATQLLKLPDGELYHVMETPLIVGQVHLLANGDIQQGGDHYVVIASRLDGSGEHLPPIIRLLQR